VTEGWRRLHNEEFHNLYALANAIRVVKSMWMRWAAYVACTGEMRNAYNILVGKPEGKRPLRRPRCKWEDIIKLDLGEIGCKGVEWMYLTQDRTIGGLL